MSSAAFLEEHAPARAAAWEAAALDALAGAPAPLMPWPWVALGLVFPSAAGTLRVASDLGQLYVPPRGATLLRVKVCVGLTWIAMRLPEKEAYSLIVEGFSVVGERVAKSGAPTIADAAATQTQKRTRAHFPELPATPAPGYMFADADAAPWDAHLLAGDVLTIAFRNTGDAAVSVRVRGEALVPTT